MADFDPSRLVDWIVARLAALRREQGLTLQELADRSGVNRSYVGLLEKGKRRPTLEVALRLAHALDYRFQGLLDEADAALGPNPKKSTAPLARNRR